MTTDEQTEQHGPLPDELYGYKIESLGFEGPKTGDIQGFTIRALYLKSPFDREALIEVFKDGQVLRKFLWPAYKIWNLAAHFQDIVSGELNNDASGYEMAGWSGFPNTVLFPQPTEAP